MEEMEFRRCVVVAESTTLPLPCTTRIYPSLESIAAALRTVVRLTENSFSSSASVGNSEPTE